MTVQSLNLTNFRNYSSASFTFSPTTTLILGPNAAGKTNVLEAVYYLASGKSFRASYDREAIAQGSPFTNLKSQISNLKYDEEKELELQILANENGENTSSKRFKVNGVKKRRADFVGNLRAVYFGPEEILLVTGSPSRRRKYLDSVLVQVDRDYARALSEYEKVLRQRNRLLFLIREGEQSRDQLDLWDPKLLSLGSILSKKRREMFADFNGWLKDSGLFLLFQPRPWSDEKGLREREIAAGMTLHGAHRDNFTFQKNGSENSENSVNQKVRESENQTHRRTDALSSSEFSEHRQRFLSAINDDLNFPQALAVVWDLVKSARTSDDLVAQFTARNLLQEFDEVLGLKLTSAPTETVPQVIKQLVEEREKHRQQDHFDESDHLRQKILDLGYTVEDTSDGPEVRKRGV